MGCVRRALAYQLHKLRHEVGKKKREDGGQDEQGDAEGAGHGVEENPRAIYPSSNRRPGPLPDRAR